MINVHELSRDHPYALETAPGFVQFATQAEAESMTNTTRSMTSQRVQNLLTTYGVGQTGVTIPAGTNLVTYFANRKFGVFHLDALNTYVNAPAGETNWGDVIMTSHEVVNYKTMILITASGILYTAAITNGAFSGWRKKIEMADIPMGSTGQAGLIQLLDSVGSGSTTQAATANAARVAYETGVNANNNANGRVPTGRRINGYALTGDVNLSANDVGAYTKAEVNALLGNASTDVRLGAPQTIKERRATERVAGGVMTSWADYGSSNYWVVLRTLQIYRNGAWSIVPYTNA